MDRLSCLRIAGVSMLLCASSAVGAVNITLLLQTFPSFSILNRLLSVTGVADEINGRSAYTLLAPDDSVLGPAVRALNGSVTVDYVANVVRFHVLLQYLDIPAIKAGAKSSGDLVATLYHASGNPADPNDFLNLTTDSANIRISIPGAESAATSASVVTSLTQSPFSYSLLQIDHVLIPNGLESPPPSPSPSPAPAPPPSLAPALSPAPAPSQSLPNITEALEKAGEFSVLLSLLQQAGVVSALTEEEMKTGVTIFAPTDDAFTALPSTALASLTDSQKKTILLYHVLPGFLSLTKLHSISSAPSMKTLASGSQGSTYTLHISSSKGTVTIVTGVDTAEVTTTVVNQTPVSVYAIDKVLLPPEIFAHSPAPAPTPALPPSPLSNLTPEPTPLSSSPPTMAPSKGAAPAPGSPPHKSPASSLSPSSLLHLIPATVMASLYLLLG